MADLSKIKLNGTTYNFKDAQARTDIANFEEADPVFSASAAAGITSDNINAWKRIKVNRGSVSINKTTNVATFSGPATQNISFANGNATESLGRANRITSYVDINNEDVYYMTGYSWDGDGSFIATFSCLSENNTLKVIKTGLVQANTNTSFTGTYSEINLTTTADVNTAITSALGNITGFSVEVVQSLPATGEQGIFYFIPNSGSGNNIYDEYVYVNNAFEKIGSTEIDLSNYLQTTDIAAWAKAANKPTYTASEVGALPDTYTAPVTSVNGATGTPKTSFYVTITGDSTTGYTADKTFDQVVAAYEAGYAVYAINGMSILSLSLVRYSEEQISNIGFSRAGGSQIYTFNWTKNSNKISFTSANMGTYVPTSRTINNKALTSDITLTASDIGALPDTTIIPAAQVQSDWNATTGMGVILNKPTIPTVPTNVSAFTNDAGYLTSYTETDPVYSASAAAGITAGDISNWNDKSDFSGSYNDLSDKPTIPTVPTNVSAFTNDAGYLTSYTETDPTVPAWAKAASKPSYTAVEVGALPSDTAIPSKVSDLNNDTGFITSADLPTKVSDLDNDAGYLTSFTETDPVFTASAAAGITASDITNWNGKTDNTGTVTSVRVQATSPVQSSVNTAQNTTLNTTISLANGYGDTKNPYASKTAKYVLAAPNAQNGVPTFRALVASDLPSIGNITNGGDITTTATIASGDRLIINDESASKVINSSITFGTNTKQYLANNGTWQNAYDDTDLAARVTALENLEWATYYSGRSNPSDSQGQNGDIYLQY